MKNQLVLIVFLVFQTLIVKAQSSTASTCNSINNLNDRLSCVMHIYQNTDKVLDKSYNKVIYRLQNRIQKDSLKYRSKNLSILNLIKSYQLDWILRANYNAKVHYFLTIGKLKAQISFYKSKIIDNKNQTAFFTDFLSKKSKFPN